MTTRKRDDFFDLGSSDDEGSDKGYDSENAEESKGRSIARSAKRRRVSDDEESGDEDGDDVGGVELDEDDEVEGNEANYLSEEETQDADADDDTSRTNKPRTKPKKNKTGVIYFSSLPPYLKPFALKSLLVQRGFEPITKIFLTPSVAPSSRHTGAAASTGKKNKRRMYTDGWVEFASKRTAKICAETLNASIVGGKKGGWYHDDIWNMKYLRGFKWADLMEQVQRERREAEAKRRIEDARARKEEKMFLAGVEKGKVVEGIKKKREEKGRKKAEDEGGVVKIAKMDVRRVFRQNEVKGSHAKQSGDGGKKKVDADTQRVLGKIF